MKLMTQAILKAVPKLRSQDGKGDEAKVYAKFFTPDSSWTWYMTEFDPETQIAFGLVAGHEVEIGYFDLNELRKVRGLLGLPVERDMYNTVKTIAEARRYHQQH